MSIYVPPIKIQGIKTKLIPFIEENISLTKDSVWIEPFMGSGIVGFNLAGDKAIFADTNPYIIDFYNALKTKTITPDRIRSFLEKEGKLLEQGGADYYNTVRDRFNKDHNPLDFLFLNRCCFNGMIRFNRKGGFNTPYGHKPNRFSKAYITKIVNQAKYVFEQISNHDWLFICQSYEDTISLAQEGDFIYCDPPYLGRHTDYFDCWDEEKEKVLHDCLSKTKAKFMLSTWDHNRYRKNENIDTIWSDCYKLTKEHFYFLGGKEANRNSITEALLTNYKTIGSDTIPKTRKTNEALNQAKKDKKNEFYTTYETIENEMVYYVEDFKDKRVLCNCNDNEHSNFYQYFTDNFDKLQLKSVTCVSYDEINPAYTLEVTKDGIHKTWLEGTGAFESEEGIELLKACDIVVTNPPFERMIDFLLVLEQYQKKFIILGNINNLFTMRLFPLVRDEKIYLGKSIRSGGIKFYVPEDYPLDASVSGYDKHGRRFISVASVRWLQNIKFFPCDKPLELTCCYDPEVYSKYDNYDFINVDKTREIPRDYWGVMGVPITYMDKHNPDLFEIKYLMTGTRNHNGILPKPILHGKERYKRLCIQRKGVFQNLD